MHLRMPRLLYLAFVMVGLVVLFATALAYIYGHKITGVELGTVRQATLAFSVVAVIGLVWLSPRRRAYTLGILCMLVAFVGFWLASPQGGLWISNVVQDPNYGPYGGGVFAILFLLFPLGWVLLSASVADWKIGIVSYFLTGLIFLLMSGAAGLFGPVGYGSGQMPPWVPVILLLLWPEYTLMMLGTFGYTFG